MNRSSLWQWAGFALSTLGGTLLHFLYDWTNGSIFVAPFSGVNESTWEHMKLLFFPLFLFAIVQYFFFKEQKNYWCVKLLATLAGLILMPVLFYTLNGTFGTTPDYVNITIFYICAAVAFLLEWYFFKRQFPCKHPHFAFAGIVLIGVLFVAFTFSPPQIPLFQDPLTGNYGI